LLVVWVFLRRCSYSFNGTKATFFVIGERLQAHPELGKMIVEEGHELANHDYTNGISRFRSAATLQDNLQHTHNMIVDIQGYCRFFRPGCGIYSTHMVNLAQKMGYKLVLADVYPHDVAFGFSVGNAEVGFVENYSRVSCSCT